jgi:hypothetical protein
MSFLNLYASHVMSSLTPPYCPCTTSKGKCDKYTKQVSKGNLLVEVRTTML